MKVNLRFYRSLAPNVARYLVKYGNSTNTYANQVEVPVISPSPAFYTGSVEGLDPTQTWFFRAFAVSPSGAESPGSNEVNTDIAPSAPSTLSIVSMEE